MIPLRDDNPAEITPVVTVGLIVACVGVFLYQAILWGRDNEMLVLIPLGFVSQMVSVPAVLVLGLWFVMQVLYGGFSIGSEGGGVAFFTHVGGFLTGMALIGFFKHSHVRFFHPPHWHS